MALKPIRQLLVSALAGATDFHLCAVWRRVLRTGMIFRAAVDNG